MMRVRQILLAVPALLAAVVLGLPAAASAATLRGATGGSGAHCVVQLRPAKGLARSSVVAKHCFHRLAAAVRYATGAHLSTAASPQLAAKTLRQAALRPASRFSPDSQRVIGIEYKNADFGGASFTFTGSSACTGGIHYDIPNTHAYGFGDNISSARTYANCAGVHYEDKYFGGNSIYVYGSQAYFGSMNDETSSIRFS
jgi:hypothetical protein